jgi:UDP-glucose 4-epimerase
MLRVDGKRVLVTGGTGSLGKRLVRRLLSGEMGQPAKVVVFSRDEAKQHQMRVSYLRRRSSTDEVIYGNLKQVLEFRIGDVRDFNSVASALRGADVVFNAAALKQVPTCEYVPWEAVATNVLGPENIVRAIEQLSLPIETVVGISTDKACKPVNVMGMTKALQERLFVQANLRCATRFVCVRYGNVLASRGSVIPLFREQLAHGGPITITSAAMTRFLLSLEQAVDTVLAAYAGGGRGETYIPRVPSALVTDIADVLAEGAQVERVVTGVRPGEKIHEILISEEECHRSVERDGHYVILPMLPELRDAAVAATPLAAEYSSADHVMDRPSLRRLFDEQGLLVDQADDAFEEFLR